ncbi:TonB-dependent receptor [Chryseotalea sanaruensis]|uniref:TonB-dependent receptor n=1 Tax=Chryseotalea sanaruensis TaxID=2482724 RepID=A0A401UE57_9BACT|nr:TonB-dependent receptor [Chryseotalea sanaruensis]GCC53144.1 TonB-dependent receptor [Chryseotalea sanaruensis]
MLKFYEARKNLLLLLLLLVGTSAWAQEVRVSGRVTSSDDGSPLPGVNIAEKGTSNGTISDTNGNYGLAVKSGSTLIFSFVGYASQEVEIGGRTTIDIVLETDILALSEIVVVGYGQQEKKDITGAVTDISTKDFNRGVITSPQDLLVGKLAGVSVTTASGAPGSNATIRIRSGSSLNASNDPLIVIDGFPVERSVISGISNPLASINPNDIETFTVLKDASATAIYGNRASNGVIIITTKRGKAGKPVFNFNTALSFSTPIKYYDVLSGDEYRTLVNELAVDGISGINQTALDKLGTANTDWQREIYRTAVSSDNNLSASGSIKNIPFRASYGYTTQQGILRNTDLQRHSLNLSVTPLFLDNHLKVNLNVKGSNVVNNFGEQGAIGSAVTFDPTQPVRDPDSAFDGYFSWANLGAGQGGTSNPVAQLEQTDNVGTVNRILTNAEIEYKFHMLPELKLNVNAGLDYSESDGYNRVPITAEFLRVTNSGVTTTTGRDNTYSGVNRSALLDVYLNYAKEIGIQKFDVTAGFGEQTFLRERFSSSAFADGTNLREASDPSENYLRSFFGRLNYSLNDKYLITATIRNDLSSRFSKDNRSGLFPSIAVGWRIKDEAFLANVNFLSDLKVRASYGITGQQDIANDYPALALYTASDSLATYEFGGVNYVTLRPEEYDANIKWETTATYNLGVDFGMFENRLTGSVELYRKNTDDLLSNIQVPAGSNFSNFLDTNIGSIESKGVEVSLQGVPISNGKLTWNAGLNFTYATNEITKLLLVDNPDFLGLERGNVGVAQNIQNHQVGYAPFSFFTFQQVYDAAGKPIEGLFVNRSGDPTAVVGNNRNKYRYQKPVADYLIGVNSRVSYVNWDFAFSGRLSLGNYVYNNNLSGRAFYNNIYGLDHFRNVPRSIYDTDFVNQQQLSDYYVQDASFFKMDNMSLGYTLNDLFASKLKARFSLTVQNAFIVTKYDGIDPEVDGGIDNNIYPRPRVFLLGVNLDF